MVPVELGRIWAQYYRKRQTDSDALAICVSVSKIVKGKAHLLIGDPVGTLTRILNEAEIAMDQFEQFELESKPK